MNVNDIIETSNHFKYIDSIIDNAHYELSEKYIKELHLILKSGTSYSKKDCFSVGEYKKLPNEVGGINTTSPEKVHEEIKALLNSYKSKSNISFYEILKYFRVDNIN